jgi:hypothetical protein
MSHPVEIGISGGRQKKNFSKFALWEIIGVVCAYNNNKLNKYKMFILVISRTK